MHVLRCLWDASDFTVLLLLLILLVIAAPAYLICTSLVNLALRVSCTREQFKRYRCTGQKARVGYGNGGNRTQGANHSGGKKSAACPLAEAGGPGFPHAGAGIRPAHANGPQPYGGIRREPVGVPKSPGGMVAPAALRLADWTPRTANATGPGRRSTVQGATRATPRPVKRLAGHPGRFSVGRLSRGVAVMGRK